MKKTAFLFALMLLLTACSEPVMTCALPSPMPADAEFPDPPIRPSLADFEQAVRNAEHGDAAAQLRLGRMYGYSETIMWEKWDEGQAEIWIRKAAEQGYAEAQYQLGWLYDNDKIYSDDGYATAFAWYRKAAEQGYAPAQYELGQMYNYGRKSTARDKAQAVVWLNKAAEQGNAKASLALVSIYSDPSLYDGGAAYRDDTQAFLWMCKAARQGNFGAQLVIGEWYENPEGWPPGEKTVNVPQDQAQANLWYQAALATLHKADEQGHEYARYQLGNLYARGGAGVPKDCEQAKAWWRKSGANEAQMHECS
ncbi:MAG: sel1 repeat family protein [Azonexus sp.]|jgi:TPR repeat protein|nr:sel1 repeat family protein [Azonexus sp.]